MINSIQTIIKYFNLLKMDKKYSEFYPLLAERAEKYDLYSLTCIDLEKIGDSVLNLAWVLVKCDALERKYKEYGIDRSIFIDTISDVKIWADTYFDSSNGKFGLGDINWLLYHLEFRIFRLGRLQFAFGEAEMDFPEKNLKNGERIIEIHIPEGSPLTKEACRESLDKAKEFFTEHFPDYKFKFFTCHSWLLDPNLKKILKKDANILKFAELFDIIASNVSYEAVKYVFGWAESRESVIEKDYPEGTFKKRMRDYLASGGILEDTYGIITF